MTRAMWIARRLCHDLCITGAKNIVKPNYKLFNTFSSAAAYLGSCLPTHVPKALLISDPLLIGLSRYNVIPKRLNRVFHTNHKGFLEKQESRKIALSALQEAIVCALAEPPTQLDDFKQLVFEAFTAQTEASGLGGGSDRRVIQYIEKLSGRAFAWVRNNTHVYSLIQDAIEACKKSHISKLRTADWNQLKRTSVVREEILNKQVMRNLRAWCGQASDLLMHYELDSTYWFKTNKQTELCIRGAYLKKKGLDWAKGELRNRAVSLEGRMENEIETYVQTLLNKPQECNQLLNNARALFDHVKKYFVSSQSAEPWSHCQNFVNQLLLTKCKEAFSIGTWGKVSQLKTEIDTQVDAWRKELSDLGIEHVSARALLKKASHLKMHFQQHNRFARQHSALSDYLVGEKIEGFKPKANPKATPKNLDKAELVGKYFKKTNIAGQNNTRIHTPGGKVYELLNTLAYRDSTALYIQHRLEKSGKVVLGSGTFGKVRLARDVSTQHIVAVKKFGLKSTSGPAYQLNQEMMHLQWVKDRAKTLFLAEHELNSLASMLDFAYINNGKSYLFIPLANGGDGSDVVQQLAAQRANGEHAQAEQRFLNIAKGYARAVMSLHELGLHHRDIKPANFVHMLNVGHAEETKLSDFGAMQSTQKAKQIKSDGTNNYCPPEKFSTEEGCPSYDAEKHDVFSLGVSLLELKMGIQIYRLCPKGSPLLDSRCVLNLKRDDGRIWNFKVPLGVVPKSFSKRVDGVPTDKLRALDMNHLDNIIGKLIAKDPAQRLTAAQAFEYFSSIKLN